MQKTIVYLGFISFIFLFFVREVLASGETILEKSQRNSETFTLNLQETETQIKIVTEKSTESGSQISESPINSSPVEILIELNSSTGSDIIKNFSGTEVSSSKTGKIISIETESFTGSSVLPITTGSGVTNNSAIQNSSGSKILATQTGVVVLNEIMVNPVEGKEWIEIYNNSSGVIDLSNWQIFDTTTLRYTFAEGIFLEAEDFFTVELYNILNNGGDKIFLKNAQNELIDQFSYGTENGFFAKIDKGESVGRSPDGSSNWVIYTAENTTHHSSNFAYYEILVPIVNIVTQTASGTVSLTWENVTNADFSHYQLWENQNGSGFVLSGEFTQNIYVIQNLQTRNVYEFLLKACNNQGNCTNEEQSQLILIKDFLQLQLNEVFANTKGKDEGQEWIELYYAGSGKLILDDYFLEIDEKKTIDLFGFAIGCSGAYLTLNPADFGVILKNSNGQIALHKNEIESSLDEFFYLKAQENYSWRRNLITNQWEEKIRPTPNSANVLINNLPEAFISIQGNRRTSGEAPFSVNVTGVYSHDPDGDKFTCFWDYDDGTFSNQCNPTNHKYDVGEFDLTLTVTDILGGTGSVVQHISVKQKKNSDGGNGNIQPEFKSDQAYAYKIQFNAFLPNPEGKDQNAEWIEIVNSGNEAVSLDWWQIDDAEGGSRPYFIPINTWLESQEVLRFSSLKTGLNLNNFADEVRLISPNGTIFANVVYTQAPENGVYQKISENIWEWNLQNAEDERKNIDENVAEFIEITETKELEMIEKKIFEKFDFSMIEISEFMPNSSQSDQEFEWIELYNQDTVAHDLFGWKLDDEIEQGSSAYFFPENTVIEPQGYLLIYSCDSKVILNNDGDTVNLLNSENQVQESFNYTKSKRDWSWSKNEFSQFIFTQKTTAGEKNFSYLKVKKEKTPKVKIVEMLPNPEGKDQNVEYFTIKNYDTIPVNLNNWHVFNQKMDEVILSEIWLQPQEEKKIYYVESGITLHNTKGALSLFSKEGVRTDFFNYNDVQEGEIFTHMGGNISIPILKKAVELNLETKEYINFDEIKGVVLKEINSEENSFWLKTEDNQEIKICFDRQKIPLEMAKFIFQKNNTILIKGNFIETGLFILDDVILLQQFSSWQLGFVSAETILTCRNLFYLLLICFFYFGLTLLKRKNIRNLTGL